jgi:hypothetical protein
MDGVCRFLLSLALLCSPAIADTCTNPPNWRDLLPPAQYRHEPSMPFSWATPATMVQIVGLYDGSEALGNYGISSKRIYICRGLTGKALWAVRMHEEAHGMGWRHP